MSTNHSQTGHIPTEAITENNDHHSGLEQLLSGEIIITNDELLPLATTNMIPSQTPRIPQTPQQNNVLRRQHARRGRQQHQQQQRQHQQQQRQRQQRQQYQQQQWQWQQYQQQQWQWQQYQQQQWQQQQWQQALQRYQEENRRRRRQRQRQRRQQRQWERQQEQEEQRQQRGQQFQQRRQLLPQWSPRPQQHQVIRWQEEGELTPEDFDEVRHQYPDLFEESFNEMFNEIQLEVYDLEKMDPKERWEQEQINEIERTTALEQQDIDRDYIEQLHQIATMEQSQERTVQQRNANELIQLEEWEQLELWHRTMQ